MAARTKARKRALDILYEADLRGRGVGDTLAARVAAADPPVADYAIELVEGVVTHAERIDELIATYAEGWTLDRMPAVDRNLLRMAIFELLWASDVPDPVVISEAVELAKQLSTDESPRFINGVLARLLLHKPQLSAG